MKRSFCKASLSSFFKCCVASTVAAAVNVSDHLDIGTEVLCEKIDKVLCGGCNSLVIASDRTMC